jgi:GT2 family glycosyltransferase
MLSIIVAVHNQLGHNKLFLDGIRRYTTGEYEVIVIDNHSTDGSSEFFEANRCRVIRNPVNLCYPESMNLGIREAKGEFLCLINNDLYVGPNWNGILVDAMNASGLDVVSPLGVEMMPTPSLTNWTHDRWAAIGRGRLSTGKGEPQLRRMIRQMYGDWEEFCGEIQRSFGGLTFDGLHGACVMMRRSLIDRIGYLDERLQAADWDLYFTLRKREEEKRDVRRYMMVGGAYVHHFVRATMKGRREPFACTHPRLSIDEKWTSDEQTRLTFRSNAGQTSSRSAARAKVRQGKKLLSKVVRYVDGVFAWRWLLQSPERILGLYRHKFQTLAPRP